METELQTKTIRKEKPAVDGMDNIKNNGFGVECKFSLVDNGQFLFGPGSKALFELIEKTGSVKSACEEMGMSYSKAWKKIREAQETLGCEVVVRVQGGKGGGQAMLTPTGKWLCETYTAFVDEATAQAKAIFERHFAVHDEAHNMGQNHE